MTRAELLEKLREMLNGWGIGYSKPSADLDALIRAAEAEPESPAPSPAAPQLSEEDARYLGGFVRILRKWSASVPVEVLTAAMQAGEVAVRGSSCDVKGCRLGGRCGWPGHRGEL